MQDDTFLLVPPTSPPPLQVPLHQPSHGGSSSGVRDNLSKGLPGAAESIPEEEEEEEEEESHHVSLEESIPEVSELHYLSDVGSEQVRATTSRVEEGTLEVEIMVTREETRAESPVHSIHNVDTDSESTAKAIRRVFGDDFPGLPWMPNMGFSNISVRQCNGMFVDVMYVQFAIKGEEPYIYSCNGIGAPKYRQKLYASACYNQFPHNPEETIDVTGTRERMGCVMDLPRSAGQVSPPGPRIHPPFRSTPIPIPKHACMHWAFCKRSGCKWHA
jgi:hypothetical protein